MNFENTTIVNRMTAELLQINLKNVQNMSVK